MEQTLHHLAEPDRVRANTETSVNDRIDGDTERRLRYFAAQPSAATHGRLQELDREWDLERVLEVEASSMGLVGLALLAFVDKRLLVLPGFVSAMMFLHATPGWYPLLPMFHRLGLRSRNEIDRERYALKALRGDFSKLGSTESQEKGQGSMGSGSRSRRMNSKHLGHVIEDRVRQHTPCTVNERVDRETQACLDRFAIASRDEITAHIHELDREWDIERRLQANAPFLALSGVVLGATFNKKWLAVPGVVFSFLLPHAIQGWCPPMPVFRNMGARTAKETDRDKYALRALRGHFDAVSALERSGEIPDGS